MGNYEIIQNIRPKEISRGILMWEVHLNNSMITYFELEPYCGHDFHKHENEQITYIIEGKMTFEFEGQKHLLSAGDIIKIQPNVLHKTYACELRTKTIDCWFPIRKEFL
jgi:quercetin dioxygenase-like cupin family protein